MKLFKLFFPIAILTIFCYASCKKQPILEDTHTYSLRKKSLAEIKATIAGTWEIKKAYSCGFAGCNYGDWTPGDFISFLSNDTIKRVTNNITTIYEKAIITREYNFAFADTSFFYSTGNGYQKWAMDQIKNDTLLLYNGLFTMYLSK